MILNNPFYADLSTYSPDKSIPFYESIFGWKFYESDDYYMAFLNNKEIAGLYETPDKFKQMRMPHFWMTYIRVESVAETVGKAKKAGGIIEANYTIKNVGNVALIRDPQGAGLTIYEGGVIKKTRTKNTANTLIWNELHVSNAQKVIPFYQAIFNWEIIKSKDGVYKVLNGTKEHIADILELPIEQKGKYEYWVCTFGVKDLETTKNQILETGGNIIIDEGSRMLFSDNSNEAFFYIKEV